MGNGPRPSSTGKVAAMSEIDDARAEIDVLRELKDLRDELGTDGDLAAVQDEIDTLKELKELRAELS